MRITRREKVFGTGRAVPLDRNAKARIQAYARAWNRLHAQPGQHRGPLTRAFQGVLEALLWGFHNSRTGICFPSYERIAEKAECSRTTVYEALRVLELAGILSWQHRLARIRERCIDLFGRVAWRWRVIRASNAYVFIDPLATNYSLRTSEFGNRAGTHNQEDSRLLQTPKVDPDSALEHALARLGAAISAKNGIEAAG
jgi:hypothetical protein